jgi:hypothetical protein
VNCFHLKTASDVLFVGDREHSSISIKVDEFAGPSNRGWERFAEEIARATTEIKDPRSGRNTRKGKCPELFKKLGIGGV